MALQLQVYILDIIPLASLPFSEGSFLSYFHSQPLLKGIVVEILVGRRTITGVVYNCDPIAKRKNELRKNVDFELKGIVKVINSKSQVSDIQFDLAQKMSEYYFAPLGVCLKTILPPFWGKRGYSISIPDPRSPIPDDRSPIPVPQSLLLCAEQTAVEYFAKKHSKENPLVISSKTNNKEYYKIWQQIQNPSASVRVKSASSPRKLTRSSQLIIGTRVGLFLPFNNLKKIIVDDATNDAYKSDMMPRYNGADFAQQVALIHDAVITLNDLFPRIGTKNSTALKLYSSTALVDMVREIKDANYSIFSRYLKEAIYQTLEKKQNLILYIPRRGHANFLLCQTCGKIITCPNCSTSLVLHKQDKEERLLCHHCTHRQNKPKQCPSCKGYSLKAKGIGIEKVVTELKKFFVYQNLIAPPIFQLDSDSTNNNDVKERAIISQFESLKPSILVTTQIIFSHRHGLKKVPIIGIVNVDTLIKIPDFRTEESLVRDIVTLSSMTDYLLIQTYNKNNPTLNFLANGEISKWVENELKSRKMFGYPPFSQLVKLTYKHRDFTKAKNEANILYEKLKQVLRFPQSPIPDLRSPIFDPRSLTVLPPFKGFINRERNQYIWHLLLKVDKSIDMSERNELLSYVPIGWMIDVDPNTAI